MKKVLTIALLLASSIWGLSSQFVSVKLSGEIKGLAGKEVVLLDANTKELMRVNGEGDSFFFQIDAMKGDGRAYTLHVPALGEFSPSADTPQSYFFIDQDHLTIDAVISDKYLEIISIKGSPMMDEYNDLLKKNDFHAQLLELIPIFNEALYTYTTVDRTEENRKRYASYADSISKLKRGLTKTFFEMIPMNRKSHALFLHIYRNVRTETAEAIEPLLQQFDPEFVKTNYYGQMLTDKLERIKKSAIGAIAPELELVDLEGKNVKLSSYRGKYVLIDFWASWCGPCRAEISTIRRVHEKYKDKGLQIIAVSVDKDEKAWRKAVDKEKMDWPQWRDTEMISGKLYNFSLIPFIMLISPEGIILEKQLYGERVDEAMKKYFVD